MPVPEVFTLVCFAWMRSIFQTHDGSIAYDDPVFAGDELYVSMTLVSTYDGRVLWHARDALDLEANNPAHVDRMEDPVDLYRVWAPAHRVLRARSTGSVALRLLRRATKTRPVAIALHGLATYRNGSGRGSYLYLEVRPHEAREASYNMRVTVAGR